MADRKRRDKEPVSRLLHELAQPLATAVLAVEIARIVAERGEVGAAAQRLDAAMAALEQMQALLAAHRRARREDGAG
ncbi:hypothetical protein [Falsiroseomonas selenitidurans]|uniref:Signal transduction histidine kinase dimerisation/phosphoacceptor domain-containing protein n=1 Tax=Falsiroseomonas selenitidurans TaxID=2716335 RepID=A0ABX1E876_9PROT|nr:hypothetical protein [Falsiroseomonas selenitidurans]NKC33392.1 hypothetical protein [Falsiroseomonas selenitidurans]